MKRSRDEHHANNLQPGADFFNVALSGMKPEFIRSLARQSPDMVFEMLKAMDPGTLASAVNEHPELFTGMFSTMPRTLMRRLLTEEPDLIFGMLRNIDPEILMDMMGLEED